jgi:hypothetical protein
VNCSLSERVVPDFSLQVTTNIPHTLHMNEEALLTDLESPRGGVHIPPPPPVQKPDWTPNAGSSALDIPLQGVRFSANSPWYSELQVRGTAPNLVTGRLFRIEFDTKAFVHLFGPGIMQNKPGTAWANLNCAFCPLEQLASFLHDNQRTATGQLALFTARDNDNRPNPCVGVTSSGITAFLLFVALPNWNQICHFDVELMYAGDHGARRKFTQRLRYLPGHPAQFV